jgi:hypothetical protein
LNKPGKLTTAEFAKMKRHADIGADLLSSIRFPYPVVPIVRHHHENWDGTGYPTGLSGADIPLGARILSVVDCFDALTSDRPYRPALSDQEAFSILRDRRGNMYDPLVVDSFIAVYSEIAPAARIAGEQARSLTGSLTSPVGLAPIHDIRTNAALSAALGDVRRYVDRSSTIYEALSGCARPLALILPCTVVVVYRYDTSRDLLATHAFIGSADARFGRLIISNGEQITGWAIANDRTIDNSPAILDLGDIATSHTPPLQRALATPIRREAETLGAITIYTHLDVTFTEDHRYAIEQLAEFLASRPDLLHHRHPITAKQLRAG